MKRKILSFILVACLAFPCMFMLSACGKKDNNSTMKVMNVGMNPKLEFVLDTSDKVVSVNALNDDGNHIISLSIDEQTSKSLFENITASEAIDLFLELTKENGYLITGNEEEIKIEISGDSSNLMNNVKFAAEKFFQDNNLDIEINTDKIEKQDLIAEVEKCFKELDNTKLNNMTEEQLIDLLKDSRKETSDMLTEELKDVYYNLRAEKLNFAELEVLYNLVKDIDVSLFPEELQTQIAEYKQGVEDLLKNIESLEQAYETFYLDAESTYNTAKDAYITAKENLLSKRLELQANGFTEAEKEVLSGLEQLADDAKDALEQAKTFAEGELDEIRALLEDNDILTDLNDYLEDIKAHLTSLGLNLDAFNNAKENMKKEFNDYFEDIKFSEFVGKDKSHWNFRNSNSVE